MRVCLFEDRGVVNLEPLSLTRPVFELLCGLSSLGEKQVRHFGGEEVGCLIRPQLADVFQLQRPGVWVNNLAWLRQSPTVLVNGRWLPPPSKPPCTEPCVGMLGEEVAYTVLGPEQLAQGTPEDLEDSLIRWKATLPRCPAGGRLIKYLWELVQQNGDQLTADFAQRDVGPAAGWRPSTLAVVGPPDLLLLDPTAQVDPLVLADTTRGPVVIDHHAVVTAFTRLEGPCYVGPHTHVQGAKVRAGTTLGPHCRIGGEVEASIVHGHSNKYHDGFLGHSYLGECVNLGAGTQNSDLRNDYGEVTVTVYGESVATGLNKVGCFLGDHTKTGLGTLLNTGSNVGIFGNLLPAGYLLPRYIPSFCSWWNGRLCDLADLPALLETAAQVMRRRGAALTEAHKVLYRGLFERTAAERRRALRQAEQRRLRRSA